MKTVKIIKSQEDMRSPILWTRKWLILRQMKKTEKKNKNQTNKQTKHS